MRGAEVTNSPKVAKCGWKLKNGYRYCDGGRPCEECGCGVFACYCDPCREPDKMQKCTCP